MNEIRIRVNKIRMNMSLAVYDGNGNNSWERIIIAFLLN